MVFQSIQQPVPAPPEGVSLRGVTFAATVVLAGVSERRVECKRGGVWKEYGHRSLLMSRKSLWPPMNRRVGAPLWSMCATPGPCAYANMGVQAIVASKFVGRIYLG